MSIDETAINEKIGQLKSELIFLADEIETIGQDAVQQPEKYGPQALEELRHVHMGEVLRLRTELDGMENVLQALKSAL
jgi:hypothetical protein